MNKYILWFLLIVLLNACAAIKRKTEFTLLNGTEFYCSNGLEYYQKIINTKIEINPMNSEKYYFAGPFLPILPYFLWVYENEDKDRIRVWFDIQSEDTVALNINDIKLFDLKNNFASPIILRATIWFWDSADGFSYINDFSYKNYRKHNLDYVNGIINDTNFNYVNCKDFELASYFLEFNTKELITDTLKIRLDNLIINGEIHQIKPIIWSKKTRTVFNYEDTQQLFY